MNAATESPGATIGRRQFLAEAAGSLAALTGVGAAGHLSRRASAAEEAAVAGRADDSPSRKIKIAAIALATVDGMLESNYARALRMGEISLKHEPDIILFPEAFAAGYCGGELARYAEDLAESEHLAKFRRLSADAGCMIVVGYLEKVEDDQRVRNAVVIFDRGEIVGRHYKHSLWVDQHRPYRDEPSLMVPGKEIEVFSTRLGRFAVLICYENTLAANWDALRGRVDYVLSPYNCEGDPAVYNTTNSKRLGIPSVWADRTGTVYAGDSYAMNPGTAGIVDANGNEIVHSEPGAEVIAVGEITIGKP